MPAIPFVLAALLAQGTGADSDELLRASERERERRDRIEQSGAHVVPLTNRHLEALRLLLELASGSPTLVAPAAATAPAGAGAETAGGADEGEAETGEVAGVPVDETTEALAREARESEETAAALEPVRDERFWRERMETARRRIAELEDDVEWTKSRVIILRTGLVVPTDPLSEHNRKAEVDQLLQKQADLERELAAARLEPARIREEGRREGAPPGWFR